MSILSTSGVGGELATFLRLYERKEKFFTEIKEVEEKYWGWTINMSNVYSEKEFTFMLDYIEKFPFKDEDFVNAIKSHYNPSLFTNEIDTVASSVTWDSLTDYSDSGEHPRMSKTKFREAKKHGFRKPAKFF